MDKITHKVRCEQWTKIIKECLASGMNKTAWCREHGISDKSFFYWQRRLREEAYISTIESSSPPAVTIRRIISCIQARCDHSKGLLFDRDFKHCFYGTSKQDRRPFTC